MPTNVCSFITGPDRKHNCSIHATQIILLFHQVFIMNHSQIHFMRKLILRVYLHVLLVLTSHTTFVRDEVNRKEAKCVPLKTCSAILPMDLNLLIYLAVRCHHATRERGQGAHVCSHLLASPPKPLQIRLRLGYVSESPGLLLSSPPSLSVIS